MLLVCKLNQCTITSEATIKIMPDFKVCVHVYDAYVVYMC